MTVVSGGHKTNTEKFKNYCYNTAKYFTKVEYDSYIAQLHVFYLSSALVPIGQFSK